MRSLSWTPDFDSSAGVQSSEHNNHQLLRPFPEGGLRHRPGDDKTCGRVWLRLQQRPGSSHVQQHGLCLLPQPLLRAPQPLRCSGAKTWSSHHSQSELEEFYLKKDYHRITYHLDTFGLTYTLLTVKT